MGVDQGARVEKYYTSLIILLVRETFLFILFFFKLQFENDLIDYVFCLYFAFLKLKDHNGSLLSKSRPFTLWETRKCLKNTLPDESSMNRDTIPDEWGRSVEFSRLPDDKSTPKVFSSSDKKNHLISKNSTAEIILESF